MAAWQAIPWAKVQRHVFRLQKRIYQATQRGDVRTVRKLQNLLSKSWYARRLAVSRVTQEHKGRRTARIDGAKSQYFQYDDPLEIDHIDGNRKNARLINLQVLHGHRHDVKTREKGEYLPIGLRDQHQNPEERSAGKLARSDLEQR